MAIASPDMGAVNPDRGMMPENKLPQNEIAPIVAETQRELNDLQSQVHPVKVNGRIELMKLKYIGEHPYLGPIWEGRDGILVYQDVDGTLKAVEVAMTNEEKLEFWEQVDQNEELKQIVLNEWAKKEVLPNRLWQELYSIKPTFEEITGIKLNDPKDYDAFSEIKGVKVGIVDTEPTKPEIELLKLPYPIQFDLYSLLMQIENSDKDQQTKDLQKAIVIIAYLTVVDPSREELLKQLGFKDAEIQQISIRAKLKNTVETTPDLSQEAKQALLTYLEDPRQNIKITQQVYQELLNLAINNPDSEIGGLAAMVIASSPEYAQKTLQHIKEVLQQVLPQSLINKIKNGEDLTAQEFAQALKIIINQNPRLLSLAYTLITNQPHTASEIQKDKLLQFLAALSGIGKDPQRRPPSYLNYLVGLDFGGNNTSIMERYAYQLINAYREKNLDTLEGAYGDSIELLFNLNLPDEIWKDILTKKNIKKVEKALIEAFNKKYPFLDTNKLFESPYFKAFGEIAVYGERAPSYQQAKEKDPSLTLNKMIGEIVLKLREEIRKYSNKELSPKEVSKINRELRRLSLIIKELEVKRVSDWFRYYLAIKIVENSENFSEDVVNAAKEFLKNFAPQAHKQPSIYDIAQMVLSNPDNPPEIVSIAEEVLKRAA